MAEWNDKLQEDFARLQEKAERRDENAPNLVHEEFRGALYRGGEDADAVRSGYAWGFIILGAIVVGLIVLGKVLGH
ncbi:MAG TPA: hypothetical protein VGN57_14460 [Pirellulaceae bacterium]|jgi:hypothetical protein|nr:hypothetical protein [Pirellulaceae bacterium]